MLALSLLRNRGSRAVLSPNSRSILIGNCQRQYATEPAAPKTSSSNNTLVYVGLGGAVVGGAAYYMMSGGARAASTLVDRPSALNPKEFIDFPLKEVIPLTHNTSLYRFALPSEHHILGLPVASCLITKAMLEVEDRKTKEVAVKPVIRPYTPTSEKGQTGHFDLVVKKYTGGPMSEHIASLKPGDTLSMKGPIEKIAYEPNKFSHIGMVAGGTGLTPMLQVIREAMHSKSDKTKITLLFANVSSRDIFLKNELDSLAKTYADRLKIFYTIDKAEPGWTGFTGHVSESMMKAAGFPSASEAGGMVFVCGPPGLMKFVSGDKNPDKSQGEVDPNSLLGKMGFNKDHVYKF